MTHALIRQFLVLSARRDQRTSVLGVVINALDILTGIE